MCNTLAVLGGRRPALVGASMGGGTSLIADGENHVDAAALVLVDVAARLETEGVTRINTFMTDHPDGFGSLEEVAEAIANYQPQRARPRSLEGLGKNVRRRADGDFLRRVMPVGGARAHRSHEFRSDPT